MDLGDRKKEAEGLYKQAVNLTTPSVLAFRLKGDWPTATPLFERAGQLFRQCREAPAARDCFERACAGHMAQKSPWHAAKAMEKAAEMACECRDWAGVRDCTARAAEFYLEEGRQTCAADAAAKSARAMEEADPAAASQLYSQALGWLEDAGKDAMAADTYRQAISHLLRRQRWADAVTTLLRFALSCQASRAHLSQCKAYLGAVVVWLYAGDAAQAWAAYQDALSVEDFASSDEAFAADELLAAYRSADSEAIAAALKRHHSFIHLDNQVAKLAKKLPAPGTDVGHMAAQLGRAGVGAGGMAAEEEEDLT